MRTSAQDKKSKLDVREMRHKLGMNQAHFWSPLGVTQSGGSRYESGRNMPKPVQFLLRLVHIEHVDIQNVKKEDLDVIEYLKANNAELLKKIKEQMKAAKKAAKH